MGTTDAPEPRPTSGGGCSAGVMGGQDSNQRAGRLTVSVIVPAYHADTRFERCLAALVGSIRPVDEVIVVADGDVDRVMALARDAGAKAIRTVSQSGPATARNFAARHADGDVLFFVDADVAVHPDAIGRILLVLSDEPDLAAVVGSYDDKPAETNFLSQYKNLLQHYVHQIAHCDGFTFWGACGAIRRDVFEKLGGFDESYRRPCIEDIELGYRLRAAGQAIRMCKDLQVTHLKRWNLGSLLRSDVLNRAVPWTQLILRKKRFDNDLNISMSSRLCVVMSFLLLGALALSWWWPTLVVVAVVAVAGLLLMDLPLIRFFARKRGLLFALRAIPYDWLYYLYSGVAFVIGTVLYFMRVFVTP